MALMDYLPICGVYEDEKREAPFKMSLHKLYNHFFIKYVDWETLGDYYGFIEYEWIDDWTVVVRICWDVIEEYRDEYLLDKKWDDILDKKYNR